MPESVTYYTYYRVGWATSDVSGKTIGYFEYERDAKEFMDFSGIVGWYGSAPYVTSCTTENWDQDQADAWLEVLHDIKQQNNTALRTIVQAMCNA